MMKVRAHSQPGKKASTAKAAQKRARSLTPSSEPAYVGRITRSKSRAAMRRAASHQNATPADTNTNGSNKSASMPPQKLKGILRRADAPSSGNKKTISFALPYSPKKEESEDEDEMEEERQNERFRPTRAASRMSVKLPMDVEEEEGPSRKKQRIVENDLTDDEEDEKIKKTNASPFAKRNGPESPGIPMKTLRHIDLKTKPQATNLVEWMMPKSLHLKKVLAVSPVSKPVHRGGLRVISGLTPEQKAALVKRFGERQPVIREVELSDDDEEENINMKVKERRVEKGTTDGGAEATINPIFEPAATTTTTTNTDRILRDCAVRASMQQQDEDKEVEKEKKVERKGEEEEDSLIGGEDKEFIAAPEPIPETVDKRYDYDLHVNWWPEDEVEVAGGEMVEEPQAEDDKEKEEERTDKKIDGGLVAGKVKEPLKLPLDESAMKRIMYGRWLDYNGDESDSDEKVDSKLPQPPQGSLRQPAATTPSLNEKPTWKLSFALLGLPDDFEEDTEEDEQEIEESPDFVAELVKEELDEEREEKMDSGEDEEESEMKEKEEDLKEMKESLTKIRGAEEIGEEDDELEPEDEGEEDEHDEEMDVREESPVSVAEPVEESDEEIEDEAASGEDEQESEKNEEEDLLDEKESLSKIRGVEEAGEDDDDLDPEDDEEEQEEELDEKMEVREESPASVTEPVEEVDEEREEEEDSSEDEEESEGGEEQEEEDLEEKESPFEQTGEAMEEMEEPLPLRQDPSADRPQLHWAEDDEDSGEEKETEEKEEEERDMPEEEEDEEEDLEWLRLVIPERALFFIGDGLQEEGEEGGDGAPEKAAGNPGFGPARTITTAIESPEFFVEEESQKGDLTPHQAMTNLAPATTSTTDSTSTPQGSEDIEKIRRQQLTHDLEVSDSEDDENGEEGFIGDESQGETTTNLASTTTSTTDTTSTPQRSEDIERISRQQLAEDLEISDSEDDEDGEADELPHVGPDGTENVIGDDSQGEILRETHPDFEPASTSAQRYLWDHLVDDKEIDDGEFYRRLIGDEEKEVLDLLAELDTPAPIAYSSPIDFPTHQTVIDTPPPSPITTTLSIYDPNYVEPIMLGYGVGCFTKGYGAFHYEEEAVGEEEMNAEVTANIPEFAELEDPTAVRQLVSADDSSAIDVARRAQQRKRTMTFNIDEVEDENSWIPSKRPRMSLRSRGKTV